VVGKKGRLIFKWRVLGKGTGEAGRKKKVNNSWGAHGEMGGKLRKIGVPSKVRENTPTYNTGSTLARKNWAEVSRGVFGQLPKGGGERETMEKKKKKQKKKKKWQTRCWVQKSDFKHEGG